MTHSFDSHGWLSGVEIPGRVASVEPPTHGAKVVGQPYPNWAGGEAGWVMVTYSEPPAPPAAPEAENAWWIYVGPFYDRFGAQKIPILASPDLVVQAIIKDSAVRNYLDLQRADLAAALDVLIAKGFTIDKAAILTTPVSEKDRYKG